MIFAVALSFCDEDADVAFSIWSIFKARGVAAYFYKQEPGGRGLILSEHQNIYCKARCRLYLLRQISFEKNLPSFELKCGLGRDRNLVLPLEEALNSVTPNDFLFIRDSGWTWLPHTNSLEKNTVVDETIEILKD